MADSRDLRLHAAGARSRLLTGVDARIRALTAAGAPERGRNPELVADVERWVARAGRRARGRAAVSEQVAHAWFVRVVVLAFLHGRGWQRPVTGPEEMHEAWAGWISRVPALADTDEVPVPLLTALAPHGRLTLPELWAETVELLGGTGTRVESIGWLHQHWFGELRRTTYANLGRRRADVDELAPVTQVFTPDWVARTLVDNSVGRYAAGAWSGPSPAPELRLPFSVRPRSRDVAPERSPDELTVLDPACGAGHLLTHAFDLMHDLQVARGADPSRVPARLLGEQIVGLDVDPRVTALTSFALTVKAWDRLGGPEHELPHPRVHVLRPVRFTRDELRRLPRQVDAALWQRFADADVLGSLVPVSAEEGAQLEAALGEVPEPLAERARLVAAQAAVLAATHDAVLANPPYLGTRHMGDRIRALAAQHYPLTKGDLCTMFLQRTREMCRPGGYVAVVASESWCVTTRTRRVRDHLLATAHLRTAVFVDAAAFGVRVNTVVSVLQNGGDPGPVAFTRVGRHDLAAAVPSSLPVLDRAVVEHAVSVFDRVPDRVLAFDLPPALLALYAKGDVLGDVVTLRQGMATTDNARFLRRWWEVPAEEVLRDHRPGDGRNPRWVPYNKGGSAVRWWGNQEYVVLWEDDARELREVRPASAVEDRDFFRGSVSWSNIGRNGVQFRQYPDGFVFDVAGMSAFAPDERTQLNLLGWLNTPLVRTAMDVLAPTLNYQVGDVARLPAPPLDTAHDHGRVRELIQLTRALWAQEPTSWEYRGHPVLTRPESTERERARAHVREREATLTRIRELEQASAHHWADAVEALTGVPVVERDPGPLTVRPTLGVEAYLAQARIEASDGVDALRRTLTGRRSDAASAPTEEPSPS